MEYAIVITSCTVSIINYGALENKEFGKIKIVELVSFLLTAFLILSFCINFRQLITQNVQRIDNYRRRFEDQNGAAVGLHLQNQN